MMSPHKQKGTADSTASIGSAADSLKSLMATSLRGAGDYTGLTFLDETSLREFGPELILNRMLSTKSFISTTSSAAAGNQHCAEHHELKNFKKIGEGQCGTVWALTGTTTVLKIVKDNKLGQLWNDSVMHKQAEEAFQQAFVKLRQNISLPQYGQWIEPTHDKFWDENLKLFPNGTSKTEAFLSSRIFTLPLPVRAAIVDTFAPPNIKANKDAFLKLDENQDCLVRVYLGRRELRSSTKTFRLRNFDLTVGEMECLRLDTTMYATTMARALAVLHWKANMDANDVEFVLGSSPTVKTPPTSAELKATNHRDVRFITGELDFHHRSAGMWLLDFDQCQEFSKDKPGVEQLKKGFYHNDPYYPRPTSTDPKDVALWKTFKEEYLGASASLIDSDMPMAFISAVEVEGKRRRDGGSLFQ